MKKITDYIYRGGLITAIAVTCLTTSCDDFLDREPTSQITPKEYLNEESQLAAYANGLYSDILLSHESKTSSNFGIFGVDIDTDDMAGKRYNNKYVPGQLKVLQVEPNNSTRCWSFEKIHSCNYFLNEVLPKWEENRISGNTENINHYIGEIYFLRASDYFKRLQLLGDFPIIRTTLPDQMIPLTEASKRAPRNEVARFIISDLDSAITLLKDQAPDGRKNRISKSCAQLLKSRVALFEGTWLKYFKNTAFVPNGEGWPGKEKDYNANYQYPSGNIDNEIEYFLSQAMAAAQTIADNTALVENTGLLQQSPSEPVNPYYNMFCDVDLSGYSEVLLWREFSKGLWLVHNVPVFAQLGGNGTGLTKGVVNGFLMKNGLPIYAQGSGYAGDDLISDVRKDRDNRLWLFLKEPGQKNVLYPSNEGAYATPIEPVPAITEASDAWGYSTGYAVRKGATFDQAQCGNWVGYTGSITFRAVEAYLNYMEACYEKTGSLDSKAKEYWIAVRNRAKVDPDYNKTIAATNMNEEAKNDWGAYSGGNLIDPTLYNIRRERRCELMAEALREMDLKRWRAMDQMISVPYQIEGFKLWGSMKDWYKKEAGEGSILIYGLDNPSANVSGPDRSEYLRPYEVSSKSQVLNGYKWAMAHYLQPIAIQNFLITSGGKEVSDSPIYQNPGWPLEANQGPIDIK